MVGIAPQKRPVAVTPDRETPTRVSCQRTKNTVTSVTAARPAVTPINTLVLVCADCPFDARLTGQATGGCWEPHWLTNFEC